MSKLWIHTPVYELGTISKAIGKNVFAKMECLQPSGSFKARGIGLLCQQAVEGGATHLVSSSGGNAGFTAAYVGKVMGIQTTVFVPETTPPYVRASIASEGAELVVCGAVWDETNEFALRFAEKNNAVYVPPFDHPVLWNGYASIIDEVVEQCPKPDAVVLSVGGGGLLCGIIEGLWRNNWRDVPVIAVETTGAASLHKSLESGRLVTLDKIDTLATSLAPKRLAQRAFDLLSAHPVRSAVVTDEAAVSACLRMADEHRVLVEPACGAALSVVYGNHESLAHASNVLVIVCGGIGVNLERMHFWKSLVHATTSTAGSKKEVSCCN